MLKRLDLRGAERPGARLPRPEMGRPGSGPGMRGKELPVAAVEAIVADVAERGDAAVREYTARFDRAEVDDLRVPAGDLATALDRIPLALRQALEASADAIEAHHRHQVTQVGPTERDGLRVATMRRPVDRAGLYVPGGRACYPSTVLMTAIPAQVAGVGELALCVPPGPDGRVAIPTLAAAALAGVEEVYRVGGAQAVAALAYGTETIRRVDVIAGPGNIYVSLAMRQVAGVVGVPASFAGPSEVVVVADASTPADWAAVDLIVEAEHGPDGLAWLVTWSEEVADAVCEAVDRMVAASSRRGEIEATLAEGGHAVVVDGPEAAMEVANSIAPEHLQLMVGDPEALLGLVRHAGAVFTGPFAPASVGDYLAGPSHVLPTWGSARFASALGIEDFQRRIHVISLDGAALAKVAPYVEAIAEAEGLTAHAESVRMRGIPVGSAG